MRPEVFAVADTLTAKVSNVKKTIVSNIGHLPQMGKTGRVQSPRTRFFEQTVRLENVSGHGIKYGRITPLVTPHQRGAALRAVRLSTR